MTLDSSVVVLFMKGTRENPKDGYQHNAIKLLESQGVMFTTFNVSADSDVREILKDMSRHNAFP